MRFLVMHTRETHVPSISRIVVAYGFPPRRRRWQRRWLLPYLFGHFARSLFSGLLSVPHVHQRLPVKFSRSFCRLIDRPIDQSYPFLFSFFLFYALALSQIFRSIIFSFSVRASARSLRLFSLSYLSLLLLFSFSLAQKPSLAILGTTGDLRET